MPASENYLQLKTHVKALSQQYGRQADDIKIIAVTKNHPWETIAPVYLSGCTDFGENRVQEALAKQPLAPPNIHWHLIGTLQANKIGKVLGKFSLIHSIDSLILAEKLSRKSLEAGLKTSILLQVNTSGEATKHGWTLEACRRDYEKMLAFSGIAIEGLMTMAPDTHEEKVVRMCFSNLRHLQEMLAQAGGRPLPQLSMGMSNDYPWAIAEGATLLRIGTSIFGERDF